MGAGDARREAAARRRQAGQQRDIVALFIAWSAATLRLHAEHPPKCALIAWDLFGTETVARFKQDNVISVEVLANEAGVYRQRIAEGAAWLAAHGFIDYDPGHSVAGGSRVLSYVALFPDVVVPLYGKADKNERSATLRHLVDPHAGCAGRDDGPAHIAGQTRTHTGLDPHAGPDATEDEDEGTPSACSPSGRTAEAPGLDALVEELKPIMASATAPPWGYLAGRDLERSTVVSVLPDACPEDLHLRFLADRLPRSMAQNVHAYAAARNLDRPERKNTVEADLDVAALVKSIQVGLSVKNGDAILGLFSDLIYPVIADHLLGTTPRCPPLWTANTFWDECFKPGFCADTYLRHDEDNVRRLLSAAHDKFVAPDPTTNRTLP